MKIDSYQVGMDSGRTFSSTQTRKFAFDAYLNLSTQKDEATNNISENSRVLRSKEDVQQQFVMYLWKMLFGPEKAERLCRKTGITPVDDSANAPMPGMSQITIQGFQETYTEQHENTSFHSNGQVRTADGRTINFGVDLELSSSFYEYTRSEIQAVQSMIDPLVLNFGGNAAELTDTKFLFDLDCDGNLDEISTLASGSGFLALDRNGDGIINDGSELFGTKSGDGFKDLAAFDSDHNGWIDENDEIFDRLKIYVVDESGESKLMSLKEKNVGAIFLGNVQTDFTLRSMANNNVNGAIRRTGIFLYEDGSGAGLMNHLDIAN